MVFWVIAFAIRILFAWIHLHYDKERLLDLYKYQETASVLYKLRKKSPEWQPYLLCRLFYTDWAVPPELEKETFPYLKNKGGYRHSFILSLLYGKLVAYPWRLIILHQAVALGFLFLAFWYGRTVPWFLIALLEPFAWFWSSSWLKESLLYPSYGILWINFFTPIPAFLILLFFLYSGFIRPLASLWLLVCYFFAYLTRHSRFSTAFVLFCCMGIIVWFYTLPHLKRHLYELELSYYYSYYVITEEPGVKPIRGEYAYWFGDRNLSTWDGVLKAIPIGLYNGFLNPLFPKLPLDSWKDLAYFFIIFRNLITLILFFVAIFFLIKHKTYRRKEAQIGFWLFLYAIGVGLDIGLGHTHVGAILRYQAAYLPAFWMACLSCIPVERWYHAKMFAERLLKLCIFRD